MRIYCLQTDIAWEDKPTNFLHVQKLIAAANPEPNSLLLLPEMFATGFSMNIPAIAEPHAGETQIFLQDLAQQFNSTILAGLARQAPNAKGSNRALAIAPNGKILADYAKIHPFTFAGESNHYLPGTDLALFQWNNATVQPTICYDLRFPELYRAAIRRGAQILTIIANWPAQREAHWITLLQARAIENQAYVAASNRTGSDPHHTYPGRSLIINPEGQILADAANAPGIISAEIDLNSLQTYRKTFPALSDMCAAPQAEPRA